VHPRLAHSRAVRGDAGPDALEIADHFGGAVRGRARADIVCVSATPEVGVNAVSHTSWNGRSLNALPFDRCRSRHTRALKPIISFALVP
jgi:hypothetical protein